MVSCPHCNGGERKPCVYCLGVALVTREAHDAYPAWLKARQSADTQPMKPYEKKDST